MATIRAPSDSDAAALAALINQLGYPSEAADIPGRLAAMRGDDRVVVYVAEENDALCGLATGHVIRSVHKTDPVAMLTVLVVLESARGRGVGRQLVRSVEEWARAHGATAISLTSALRRTQAHDFYRALGYEHNGVRLARELK